MVNHINIICRNSFLILRGISKIRRYLTEDAAKTLIHGFVSAKLDYCNSLLYGVPNKQLKKVQRVFNSAARMITGAKRQDSATEILKELHWLPVRERIEFKILLLVFKSLNGLAPAYLSNTLDKYTPSRPLRSMNSLSLTPHTARYKYYGVRAFQCAAPKLWNNLPHKIRIQTEIDCFKSMLKTFLYKRAYIH